MAEPEPGTPSRALVYVAGGAADLFPQSGAVVADRIRRVMEKRGVQCTVKPDASPVSLGEDLEMRIHRFQQQVGDKAVSVMTLYEVVYQKRLRRRIETATAVPRSLIALGLAGGALLRALLFGAVMAPVGGLSRIVGIILVACAFLGVLFGGTLAAWIDAVKPWQATLLLLVGAVVAVNLPRIGRGLWMLFALAATLFGVIFLFFWIYAAIVALLVLADGIRGDWRSLSGLGPASPPAPTVTVPGVPPIAEPPAAVPEFGWEAIRALPFDQAWDRLLQPAGWIWAYLNTPVGLLVAMLALFGLIRQALSGYQTPAFDLYGALDYLAHPVRMRAIPVAVRDALALAERETEELPDLLCFSFGGIIAADALFDGDPPAVNRWITIGMPVAMVELVHPLYFRGRSSRPGPHHWINILIERDFLATSFLNPPRRFIDAKLLGRLEERHVARSAGVRLGLTHHSYWSAVDPEAVSCFEVIDWSK